VSYRDEDRLEDVPRRRRPWLIALPLAIVVLIALAWTAFWFYAARETESLLAGWRDREAAVGHVYACGSQSVGGYPFRFELECREPSAEFLAATPPLALKAKDILIAAQIWEPTLVIGEFTGPLTVAERGQAATLVATWSLAQASLRGIPTAPERVSVALDKPSLARAGGGQMDALARADHLEAHVRLASGSARANPVLELAATLSQGALPVLGDLMRQPTDGEIVGVLRGLKDLAPKSLAQSLRELQAAGGKLEITRARLQQGEVIATALGTLGLSPRGALDGELQLTVVNVEKLLPLLGLDRVIAQLIPQGTLERLAPGLDRLLPGLGSMLRGGGSPGPGRIDALGQRTELEGKNAVTLPLRFSDGVVLLGPFRLTDLPPLY
jgi:hypothetical protein